MKKMLMNIFFPENYFPIHRSTAVSGKVIRYCKEPYILGSSKGNLRVCVSVWECKEERGREGRSVAFWYRFLKDLPLWKFLFEHYWFTSAHSVDPNKPNSSASQLANITVLLGFHPAKDHENCITEIKTACYIVTNVKTNVSFGGLIFYPDLWGNRCI